MVEILGDELTIYGKDGKEIVHWVVDEVEEDAELAFTIANAVKIYYEEGEYALKKYLDNPEYN